MALSKADQGMHVVHGSHSGQQWQSRHSSPQATCALKEVTSEPRLWAVQLGWIFGSCSRDSQAPALWSRCLHGLLLPAWVSRGQKDMLTDTKAINLWPLGTANDIYESLNGCFMITAELQTREWSQLNPHLGPGEALWSPLLPSSRRLRLWPPARAAPSVSPLEHRHNALRGR